MKKSITEIVFTLLLLVLFVFCSFFTIVKSADFYQSMMRRQAQEDLVQLPYLYLFTRLEQAEGEFSLETADNTDCLVLNENVDGTAYQTWIYYQDGALKELLVKAGREVSLKDGEVMTASSPFHLLEEDGILIVTIEDKRGTDQILRISMKGDRR